MITNFHTHSTFSDGNNSCEEIVRSAIELGMSAIGISDHGYTSHDLSYCVKDTEAYRREVLRLKEKYKDKIEVYLGIEEDIEERLCREDFDYILGSSHYFFIDGEYYPVDLSRDCIKKALDICKGDTLKLAESYYSRFCDYILSRRPDIIGHFDLITKYDEEGEPFFLGNREYDALAEKYIGIAAESGCIFEINTGAISRGYRKTPYPTGKLLYTLKKKDCPIILSSDSHSADTLCYVFDETRKMLRDVGFDKVYTLYGGKFISQKL